MTLKSLTRALLVLSMLGTMVLLAACGQPAPEVAPEVVEEVVEEVEEAAAGSALSVTGSVAEELSFTEDEVKALETMDVESTNSNGEAKTYTGVSLNTILDLAQPAEDATALVFVADDGYTAEITLEEVRACEDCILSFRNQGGFSSVLPEYPGNFQVKGVVELQVK